MEAIRTAITTYSTVIVVSLATGWAILLVFRPRWTLALDAALIALFWLRPWAGVLFFGTLLTAWRYTPVLASDIAGMVKADQSIGLTRLFWRFVLVGWQDESAPALPKQAATGKTTKLEAPTMPLRSMLAYVNAQPDKVPHLAIIGPSGSGKTTLATVVLSSRPGLVVVLTAKEGDTWGGLPYVGIDDDATYRTAQETFVALDSEVKARLISAKRAALTDEWLTIVVDDFSTLQSECPVAPSVVKLVARLGRSLKVRLIMLSDSALVKAIGLEGEGETRSNFAFVRLERGHAATLEMQGATVPVDTRGAERITVDLADRAFVCVPSVQNIAPQTHTHANKPQTNEADQRIALYIKWRMAGMKRDVARQLRQADGEGLDDAEWAEAGKQLGVA